MMRVLLVAFALILLVPPAAALLPATAAAACQKASNEVHQSAHDADDHLRAANSTDVPTDEGQDVLWAATQAGHAATATLGAYASFVRAEVCTL